MKQSLSLFLAMVLLLTFLPGCKEAASADPLSQQREITDMAGRSVSVPVQIDSVFSTGSSTAIYLYTLVPDRLLGWNYALNDIEKSLIPEKYHSLPNFGQKDAINYEAVIAASPDVAITVGTINDKLVSDCDALQQRIGIPVVAVDGDLKNTPEAYRFLGDLLGVQSDAEALAAYAEKTFSDIAAVDIPPEKQIRVYFGNGENSLDTAPRGSDHGQILDLVQAVNVADLELGDGSRVQISPEQLLAWDPDVILVNGEPKANISGGSAADALMENPLFATLTAVRNGKVYGTPNAPFSWVDRPPGPNRIVGIRWLSGILYPEHLNFDVDAEVKAFFRLFYHVELSDEQLQKIYSGKVQN